MADAPTPDPNAILRGIAETGKGVRLGKGVIGKTGPGMISVLAIWGVVALRFGPAWLTDVGLLVTGCAASGGFFYWMRASHSFAERNPAQAMLEGAQFIEYKRMETAVKGGIVIPGPQDTEDAPRIKGARE